MKTKIDDYDLSIGSKEYPFIWKKAKVYGNLLCPDCKITMMILPMINKDGRNDVRDVFTYCPKCNQYWTYDVDKMNERLKNVKNNK